MGWRKLILGGAAIVVIAASSYLSLSVTAIQGLIVVAVMGIGSQATVDAIVAYLAGRKPTATEDKPSA